MKIEWDKLGFDLIQTNSFIEYIWRPETGWDAGRLRQGNLELPVSATALHYGQACFEGLKAFRMKDGKVPH